MNMQNRKQAYWEALIVDSLTGSISDENSARLAQWRRADEKNNAFFREMKAVWDIAGLYADDLTFDSPRAGRAFGKRTRRARHALRRVAILKYLAYAAVAIPLIFLSYFTYRYFADTLATAVAIPLVAEIETPRGSKTQVRLPDGTLLWLNAGSTVRYGDGFGATHRALTLNGEACFDVVRNERLPLTVEAHEVKITVLGTRFNINAYADDEQITVALFQGSIEMETAHERITLAPADVAQYDTRSNLTAIAVNPAADADGWISDHLVFTGESFAQIIKILERKFDVDIHVRNGALLQAKFGGDFTSDESLEQIFSVMAANRKFTYKIRGKVIEIEN
jgi:ferric-dicitrate binding protein FerR (iron transport regulator)